jgi:PHD/YefM family antitoxin component YafN of YafNO toxin-antitoxin module
LVVTENSKAAIVIIDAAQYQKEMEEREIYLAVAQGLSSKGEFTPQEVEARLDALFSEAEIDEDEYRRGILHAEDDIRAGCVYTSEEVDAHINAILKEE